MTEDIDAPLLERVHALWDELADFDAARNEEALRHLLAALCEIAGAQNANWFGVVRLGDIQPGDPARGWRSRCFHILHPTPPAESAFREQAKNTEMGQVDETTVKNIALAGRFRVNRVVDLVPESWFHSDYFRLYFQAIDRADAIWAGIPINEDAECYFGIFRDNRHARFEAAERDAVAYALRGLKWFLRRQLLSRGLLVATTPLTPAERDVLQGLLSGQPEKQIAAARNQSPHTTHEHVTNIYRKFSVKNRAALMALWLGKGSASP